MGLKNTITIDPGRNTGIAIWNDTLCPYVEEIKTPRLITGIAMLKYLHHEFKDIISRFPRLENAIIEGVDFRESSIISKTAALRGDLSILAYVVGAYCALLKEHNHFMDIKILIAREWKGNLTKEATAFRVERINNKIYKSDHVSDAVALGFSQTEHWKLGVK